MPPAMNPNRLEEKEKDQLFMAWNFEDVAGSKGRMKRVVFEDHQEILYSAFLWTCGCLEDGNGHHERFACYLSWWGHCQQVGWRGQCGLGGCADPDHAR